MTWLSSPALAWGPMLLILAVFLGALACFAVATARHGLVQTERAMKLGGSPALGRFFIEYGLWIFRPAVRLAVRLRVHPDTISWLSLWLHVVAAFALSQGAFAMAGWVLLIGAACDSLDGSVARARQLSSDAGEVLDAVVDRWAEMVVFFGYAWYYRQDAIGFTAACAACAGAVMVSYARAKGESLQVDASMGMMQRHERATYLIVATIFSSLIELRWPSGTPPRHWLVLASLIVIAVFSNWTAIVRSRYIRQQLLAR